MIWKSNWHLKKIYKNLLKTNKKILKDTWTSFNTLVKKESPRRTGLLKKSWRLNKKELNKNKVSIVNNIYYTKFVNYWTNKIKAQNFIKKSIEKNKKKFIRILKKELNKIL